MRIEQELWNFYQQPIFERVSVFFLQTLFPQANPAYGRFHKRKSFSWYKNLPFARIYCIKECFLIHDIPEHSSKITYGSSKNYVDKISALLSHLLIPGWYFGRIFFTVVKENLLIIDTPLPTSYLILSTQFLVDPLDRKKQALYKSQEWYSMSQS